MGLRIGAAGFWSLCLQADEHHERKGVTEVVLLRRRGDAVVLVG